MQTRKHYIILAVATAILCVLALGEIDLPLLEDRQPILIGQTNPTLVQIHQLYVVIVPPDSEPNKGGLVWRELETKVKNKLNVAGVKIAKDEVPENLEKILRKRFEKNSIEPGNLKYRSINIPELRVGVDTLNLSDSQRCVFRIQTSLARAVHLAKEPKLGLKAEVWKVETPMQVVSMQNMPAVVTGAVLGQVEVFIAAYRTANPRDTQRSDANDITVKPEKLTKPDAKRIVAEYKYVASKKSKVFHKPDCRWVKKINAENLVGYKSKQEAIEAGKRPCKWCKP